MKRTLIALALLLLLPLAVGVGALTALTVTAPVAPRLSVAPAADPLGAARAALAADDPLLAIAYLEQVAPGGRQYSRAQRMIGYEVYSNRLDRPAEGLRYTFRALRAEPSSSNAWQDAARTVGALFRR